MELAILYRGPLDSCNYGCEYCPFAKRQQSAQELATDAAALERFVLWVEAHPELRLSVFFTPWGEALIHRSYQQALARLTRLPHIERVAIQTNLSCRLDWLGECDPDKLGLWATFHPEWSDRESFLSRCQELVGRGIHFSVGVVGFPRFAREIRLLREALPRQVYLWINAVKAELPRMDSETLAFFESVDPYFRLNTRHYPSLGYACRAGERVISVDGEGTIRRCHFIREPIGNLYDPDFAKSLFARPCTNSTCHCHIGYVHLEYLELDKLFGSGILERVPTAWPARISPEPAKQE